MADVFISYHVESAREIVRRIRRELERRDISCWNSEANMQPGAYFAEEIPPQIKACKVFLLILDDGANESIHVQNETHLAFERKAKKEMIDIIPFDLLSKPLNSSLQYNLAQFQRIRGQTPPTDQQIKEVADYVERAIARQKEREEAERKAREEAERRAREEAERKAREEAERKTRRAAELREELDRLKIEGKRLAEERKKIEEEENHLETNRKKIEDELAELEDKNAVQKSEIGKSEIKRLKRMLREVAEIGMKQNYTVQQD